MSEARKARPRTSRTVWIVAGLVGIACAIGFVLLMVSDGSGASARPAPPEDRGFGFTVGLVLGLVAGVAIGFGMTRQLGHSSRKRP